MPTVLSDKQKFITRSPDGLKIGPVSRRVIIDLIRDRKVTSKHTFSIDGGEFRPVTDDNEFYQHLAKYENLPPKPAYPANAISIPPMAASAPPPAPAAPSPRPAPAAASAHEVSDQARSDLDALDDEDDDDDSDFSISLHELKDAVLDLARTRQNAAADVEVMETLDEVELIEPAAEAADDDVIAIGDEAAGESAETFEEVEVLELEGAASGPSRQVAKVPTSGRARLKAELLNPENRYTIRNADGLMLGPVRIATVKDLIEHGAIDRKSQIQKNDERFNDAWAIPEIRFLIVRLSQKS